MGNEYWRRRAAEYEREWAERCENELERELAKYFRESLSEIEKGIAALYGKYMRDNALSYREARRLIRGSEFSEWRMSLQEYVAAGRVNSGILKELNTLAMRSRITRLEKLYSETLRELQKLGERSESAVKDFLTTAYRERYYHGIYDLAGAGKLAIPVSKVEPQRLEKVLASRWAGGNYSTRIWKDTEKLSKVLKQTIVSGLHRGLSVDKMSRAINIELKSGYKNAERLVRTEMNFVQNHAAKESLESAGLREYEFIAVLDHRTSQRCQQLDGTVYLLEEYDPGSNAPPMHPRCRSTISAVVEGGTRTAKVGGRNIRVPADMNYADYKAVYIDKTQTLKDWQENKAASGYGAREDTINRVLAKEKARRESKKVGDILDSFKTYAPGTKTKEQLLEQVNPKHTTGEYQWTHNCQRCVVAWELLQRGYDVTAKPYNANDSIGSNGVKLWKINGGSVLEDPDAHWNFSKLEMKKALAEAFAEWGDNARAVIHIRWANSKDGHFLTAQKINGKIIYIDPQVNKLVDINEVLKKATLVKKLNWFMRVDNREFTEYIVDAVQNWEG